MEKALEILRKALSFQSVETVKICEAIKELEEAMKPKTCSSCYWWNDFYTQCNDHDNALAGINGYGCNRYEAKDNK